MKAGIALSNLVNVYGCLGGSMKTLPSFTNKVWLVKGKLVGEE